MKRFAIALFTLLMSAAVFAQSDLQVLAVVKLNKNEPITVKQIKTPVKTTRITNKTVYFINSYKINSRQVQNLQI